MWEGLSEKMPFEQSRKREDAEVVCSVHPWEKNIPDRGRAGSKSLRQECAGMLKEQGGQSVE